MALRRHNNTVSECLLLRLKDMAHLPLELYDPYSRFFEDDLGLPNPSQMALEPDGTLAWVRNSTAPADDHYIQTVVAKMLDEIEAEGPQVSDDIGTHSSSCGSPIIPFEDHESKDYDRQRAWQEWNPWFSSLWTLQEVCVCPQMWLCTKEWDVLSIGPQDAKTPIGFTDLIALSNSALHHQNEDLDRRIGIVSPAVTSLTRLFKDTGLENLLEADRSTILALGNQRHCQDYRANAIMSAIGVTDWFESRLSSINSSSSSNLSPTTREREPQGDYPEGFLVEAASKIGPLFYATNIPGDELSYLLWQVSFSSRAVEDGVGSMFPFALGSEVRKHTYPATDFPDITHQSISKWKVHARSVRIPEAEVVSYTHQTSRQRHKQHDCLINGPMLDPPSLLFNVDQNIDLDEWVDKFMPTTRNFAVCLLTASWGTHGILLKELSCGKMIKVGTFMLFHRDVEVHIETLLVNWHVL
ncbi:hypothetical protein BDV96DRAFT_561291 [Lophiotrema nucula]|uniref:Heterokaryon incompatibility domain-containing protein n=1 Tax=Lophiotrema nucula TaxID=690887 RepID=A0A6A5ZTZ7_9PLEO|nr:hypothetical protein BDV96DRAFT_561291 [Lophiotrema nucula]